MGKASAGSATLKRIEQERALKGTASLASMFQPKVSRAPRGAWCCASRPDGAAPTPSSHRSRDRRCPVRAREGARLA